MMMMTTIDLLIKVEAFARPCSADEIEADKNSLQKLVEEGLLEHKGGLFWPCMLVSMEKMALVNKCLEEMSATQQMYENKKEATPFLFALPCKVS